MPEEPSRTDETSSPTHPGKRAAEREPEPRPGRARTIIGTLALHVGAWALGTAVVLRGAAVLLASNWAETGRLAAFGAWSLTTVYTVAGVFGGALLGALSGAAATVRSLEAEVREVIRRPPPEGARQLLPRLSLDRVEADYARVLDAVVEGTLGRLRMPHVLRSFVRRRLRPPLVHDFLETARAAGRTEVGFAELRDWLLLRGLPWVTTPLLGPLRVWRLIVGGALMALVLVPLGLALVAGAAGAGTATLVALAVAGAAVAAYGALGDPGGRDARFWRRGTVTLGAQVAVWPIAWAVAAPFPGVAGSLLLALVTLAGLRWSLDQAMVRAGPRVGALAMRRGPDLPRPGPDT